tara:strand:+ start:1690 stop:1812 length:123 start_codon:yes stop_codon:yes gene_type:complete
MTVEEFNASLEIAIQKEDIDTKDEITCKKSVHGADLCIQR